MKRKISFFLCFFVFISSFVFCATKDVKLKDVQKIMHIFLSYHVQSKDITPEIASRTLKIYVEQFDPERIYLLDEEAEPFLHISKEKAKKISENMKKNNFSDFLQLNKVFAKAIARHKGQRIFLKKELSSKDSQEPLVQMSSGYASTHNELKNRQKNQWHKFYIAYKKKFSIESLDRKKKLFSLFEKKLSYLESPYVGLKENKQAVFILKAFAKSLDAHTAFFTDEEAHEMRTSLEKQFQGIGVVLTEGIDGVIVADLVKGSPAEKSNQVFVNDTIVEIDGQSVENMVFQDVLGLMKKKDNPEIVLGLRRVGSQGNVLHSAPIHRVSLKRQPITMDEERLSYSWEPFGNGIIGKLDLPSFYENENGVTSEKDIKAALKKMRSAGPIKGIVLDLRENSGGFLSQAVKVAGLFMTNGVVVISKYSDDEMKYLRSLAMQATYNGPLIILTSKLSASASEIVAQALQDYGVALIVGDEKTFGKGSIQYQTVTNENAAAFFKVTVGKYYTVSGKTTQINGVEADIIVPSQFFSYKVGEKYLEYPLSSDKIPSAYADKLQDVNPKIRVWLKENYLTNLQRYVPFWQKMVPVLKKNSENRIKENKDFQYFLKNPQLPYDRNKQDLQMIEAVNILKDMVIIESKLRDSASKNK